MHILLHCSTALRGWLGGQKAVMFVGPGSKARSNAIKLVILVFVRDLLSPGGGSEKMTKTQSLLQT